MRVTILHLDLGIGGAEQLIVNVATVVKELGHDVVLLTSHHDKNHCFEETKPNGHLGKSVHVYGDWLPRQLFGKLTAFFAILRMLYLAIITILFYYHKTDVLILDGVSAPIPLLRFFKIKVIFYCHFPDMLLCYDRNNIIKRAYRYVLDSVEEWTTGCASLVLVNSEFTGQMYASTFKKLAKRTKPQVLYPVIKETPESELPVRPADHTPYCAGYDYLFLSLNRYERKKNIELAISALQQFKSLRVGVKGLAEKKGLLVVAGGYDLRVEENVQYLEDLKEHCELCGLTYRFVETTSGKKEKKSLAEQGVDVVFRISIPSIERTALLMQSTGLLYTPDREHFGIVPIEAMYLQVPVIAVNSGGPRETVLSGTTGFLCEQSAEEFGAAMLTLLRSKLERGRTGGSSPRQAMSMGQQAKSHVQSMKAKLASILQEVKKMP